MQTLTDYINNYGDISFKEKGFTDADNVALCYMFYMPLEQVVSASFDDKPQRYSNAASRLFAKRGFEHKPVGLILLKDISVKMMAMARCRRFAEMQVVACREVYQKEPAVQFGAGTFLLPNGQIVVVFRGTDDSLTGWKEDFDILMKESIPSHKLATDYLEEVADKFEGDIIVCGHSKGGYVAQYGALNCSKKTRDRIKLLYNNDGPGFADYSYLDSEAYKEMLPKYRHFVPQSSFIGMMLAHDDDYTVVKSSRVLGPLQHDLSTWQFVDDNLKTVEDLTNIGKINDMVLYQLVNDLTEEQQEAFDTVLTSVVDEGSAEGLLGYKEDARNSLRSNAETIEKMDKSVLNTVKSTMSKLGKYVKIAAKAVYNGAFKSVKDRIEEDK